MTTRYAQYSDYGVSNERVKEVQRQIIGGEFDNVDLLKAAESVYKEIAPELFLSVICGVSYESFEVLRRAVPINKGDFYAYRRKYIALICNTLAKQRAVPKLAMTKNNAPNFESLATESRLMNLQELCKYLRLGKARALQFAEKHGATKIIERRVLYDKKIIDQALNIV